MTVEPSLADYPPNENGENGHSRNIFGATN